MIVDAPHPAMLEPEALLEQCAVRFGRTSGPGGQHRNKVDTAVCIEHEATGIIGQATERRSQRENRAVALRRLRLELARRCRTAVDRRGYRPTALWSGRRQGRTLPVNPRHRDYPALLAEALDLIGACRFDVAGAAGLLDVSMSQLAKLVRHDGKAFAMVNEGRRQAGLPALK